MKIGPINEWKHVENTTEKVTRKIPETEKDIYDIDIEVKESPMQSENQELTHPTARTRCHCVTVANTCARTHCGCPKQ